MKLPFRLDDYEASWLAEQQANLNQEPPPYPEQVRKERLNRKLQTAVHAKSQDERRYSRRHKFKK